MDAVFVRKILEKIWDKKTAYKGLTGKTKSRGQCYVTALLIKRIYGGEIVTGKINGESHFWNILPDGTEIDLTSDQYGGDGFHPIIKYDKKVTKINFRNKRLVLLFTRYLNQMQKIYEESH